MLADKGYSNRAIRSTCAGSTSRRRFPKAVTSRPTGYDGAGPVVERCFTRLKQFRAIATRFDKTATSCRSMIDLATLLRWL